MKSTRYDEADLKAGILAALQETGLVGKQSVLTSEFRLPGVSTRADLAIFGDQLIGIEVKGPLDSLKRLDNQLAGYLSYFDHVILVAASRHIPNLTSALIRNIEVWEFKSDGELSRHREVCTDATSSVERLSPLNLLTQAERRRICIGSDKELQPHLCLSEAVSAVLKDRFGPTSKAFWKAVARRKIRPSDLTALSRFHPQRTIQKAVLKEREDFWRDWLLNAERTFGIDALV